MANAWENRERTGFMPALVATVKESMTAPSEFFAATPVEGGLTGPLVYGATLGTLGVILAQVWSILWELVKMGGLIAASSAEADPTGLMAGGAFGLVAAAVILILSPVFAILGLFFNSGVTHLALILLGGNNKGFEATFRAISYAQGPQLLNIVPVLGGVIGGIWALVIEIIGLSKLQGIEGWRATVAVLLFPCVCCVCIGVFFGLFAAALIPAIMAAGRG